MQPHRTSILVLISLALLGLGLMATMGVLGLFSEEFQDKKTTAQIEIVLKDEAGYHHFLVLDRLRSVADLSVGYSAEFWVDDYVHIDPQAVSKLVFFSDNQSWSSPFQEALTVNGVQTHPTVVFHFAVAESSLQSLAAARIARLRLVMQSGDFLNLEVVDQEKLHQAIQEILAN